MGKDTPNMPGTRPGQGTPPPRRLIEDKKSDDVSGFLAGKRPGMGDHQETIRQAAKKALPPAHFTSKQIRIGGFVTPVNSGAKPKSATLPPSAFDDEPDQNDQADDRLAALRRQVSELREKVAETRAARKERDASKNEKVDE